MRSVVFRRPGFRQIASVLFVFGFLVTPSFSEEAISPRVLRSACEDYYPPFSFLDKLHEPNGFAVELFRAVAAQMQYDVHFRTGTWPEVRSWLEKGEVEALPLVARTPEREALFDFTMPFMTLHGAIVVRISSSLPRNVDDLQGKRVAVMTGDVADEFLARRGFDGFVVKTPSYRDALTLLSKGDCDAVLMLRLVALWLIQQENIENLEVLPILYEDFTQDFCFAVREGDRSVLNILNEGLALAMADGTYRKLHSKWFGAQELPSRVVFGLDANFPPYSFENKRGQVNGFTVDIAYALAHATGMDIEIRTGLWHELIKAFENHEIDVLPKRFYSVEDESFVDTSLPIDSLEYVAIVRKGDKEPPGALAGLTGKRIVVVSGDTPREFLRERIKSEIFSVNTLNQALQEVKEQRYDCAVVERRAAQCVIQENAWDDLIVGTHVLFEREYEFAVHQGAGTLLRTINDGLDMLKSSGEYQRFYEKWLAEYDPQPLIGWRVLKYLLFVTVPLILLLFLVMSWLYTVRKEVAARVHDLQEVEAQRASLEKQLIQAQKLEAIGRLAGGIAHDFNNFLGVIIGFTELALTKVSGSDLVVDDLNHILEGAKKATDITRQLLAFARCQPVNPKVVNLNDVVGSTVTMLKHLMGEDIDLVWSPAPNLWRVKIDPAQVDQVLANLCVNARDAIKGNGKVTIETRNVVFDLEYCREHLNFFPGEYVMLAVSDDGCGMDKDILEQIFEPFFTTKEESKGTGLGLPTVYGIVKQNKGFINVYSEVGRGSTFRIYLPRFVEDETQKTESSISVDTQMRDTDMRGEETLLIVEDEPAILTTSTLMLRKMGYHVLPAASPSEAIKIAEEEKHLDLLVTDVILPEMNGRELAETIRRKFPGLKILFMSGYTANVIVHHSILEEGISFIQKPFLIKELAAKIREVLDKASV